MFIFLLHAVLPAVMSTRHPRTWSPTSSSWSPSRKCVGYNMCILVNVIYSAARRPSPPTIIRINFLCWLQSGTWPHLCVLCKISSQTWPAGLKPFRSLSIQRFITMVSIKLSCTAPLCTGLVILTHQPPHKQLYWSRKMAWWWSS